MDITVRHAEQHDIPRIMELLYQVCAVHAEGRPDLFRAGGSKYSESELLSMINDITRPIFVGESGGSVMGYAFCMFQEHNEGSFIPHKTMYIDDICIDEIARGNGIGRMLYEHVLGFARESGCYNVTLNVWECNPGARKFYESLGMSVQKTGMEQIL